MKQLMYFFSFILMAFMLGFVNFNTTLYLAICLCYAIILLCLATGAVKSKIVHKKPVVVILLPCIIIFIFTVLGLLGLFIK